MRRTTVTVPDSLARALEREAHRRRTSVSQVVRDALVSYLELDEEGSRTLPFAALGASGHHTTARDLEEVLAAEWTAHDRDR